MERGVVTAVADKWKADGTVVDGGTQEEYLDPRTLLGRGMGRGRDAGGGVHVCVRSVSAKLSKST